MAQIEFFTDAIGTMFYRENGKTRELTDTEYGIVTTMYGLLCKQLYYVNFCNFFAKMWSDYQKYTLKT